MRTRVILCFLSLSLSLYVTNPNKNDLIRIERCYSRIITMLFYDHPPRLKCFWNKYEKWFNPYCIQIFYVLDFLNIHMLKSLNCVWCIHTYSTHRTYTMYVLYAYLYTYMNVCHNQMWNASKNFRFDSNTFIIHIHRWWWWWWWWRW